MLVLLWWVFLFGVWPLAHPAHDGKTLMSILDIALHFGAGFILAERAMRWVERHGGWWS